VRLLTLIFNSHLFCALAPIKFDEGSAIFTVVAWVISTTELVELSDHVLNILSVIVAEDNCKLFLHFFQIDKGAKE
jgi:hypothetical protein